MPPRSRCCAPPMDGSSSWVIPRPRPSTPICITGTVMLLTDTGRLTWNLVDDVRNLLAFHFMVNAFRAGTIVAIITAGIGWFLVLRKETFAGHTLAVVGF